MKRNSKILIAGTAVTSIGLLGLVVSANAVPGPDQQPKTYICHPVNGAGETGYGWNTINPAQASSHIDESLYPNGHYWKHESNDGRHDVYADENGNCPGYVSPSPSTSVTPTPSHTVTPTDEPSESESVTPGPTGTTPPAPTETASVTPGPTDTDPTPTGTTTPTTPVTPPTEDPDPVVSVDTKNTPTKIVKIETHKSGKVTKTVTHYPADAVEEGY